MTLLSRTVHRIKAVQYKIATLPKEWVKCPVHFCCGAEEQYARFVLELKPEDKLLLHHRGLAAYVARGGDLVRLFRSVLGDGPGVMHLRDESRGILGGSAILGACAALAIGVAEGMRLNKQPGRVVAFGGDAILETGYFWEAWNYASLHKLKIVFAQDENNVAVSTPNVQRRGSNVVVRGRGYPVFRVFETSRNGGHVGVPREDIVSPVHDGLVDAAFEEARIDVQG